MNKPDYEALMLRALELASLSPEYGINPQVGALLIDDSGEIIAEGWHKGAGTAHAEVDALSKVADARGLTAIVTLEPCNHTGRTGPCSQALIDAGVKRVVFGTKDPGKNEGGGQHTLEAAGVEVITDVLQDQAKALIRPWLISKTENRPYVVVKWASSLDGRTAAADGTSKWITSAQSRADVHLRRSKSQAIIAGTNTVEIDNAELTARKADGSPYGSQPIRVVVGNRQLSKDLRVFNDLAETIQLKTHDPKQVLSQLFERGIRQVFVEGGATLESSFIEAGLADEFLIYLAPKLLGGPRTAIADIGVKHISESIDLEVFEMKQLGADLMLRAQKKES